MSSPIPRFETLTTKQFTITYSAAPVTAPTFIVSAGSNTGSGVHSYVPSGSHGTVASSGIAWIAYYTIPASAQTLYTYTWTASFTAGSVVHRGWFQSIRTMPG